MIFQHTWNWVINQSPNTKTPKTQTRRLVKPDDYLYRFENPENPACGKPFVWDLYAGRTRWEWGNTYAVQPARGQKSIARILILDIRREDVRNISNEDVCAEGFGHARDFLHVWLSMHDPTLERRGWGEKALMERPAKYYDAWILTFELVKP